jgi:hypothetical protein
MGTRDVGGATGSRLTDEDRATLATTRRPGVLVEMMRNTGVLAPSTMLAVLHAEGVEPTPSSGSYRPRTAGPEAIRFLHRDWHLPRLNAGALGATVDELRAAGCTAVEMLAAAPREELRRLDANTPGSWSGRVCSKPATRRQAVQHLALHAPTPAMFASVSPRSWTDRSTPSRSPLVARKATISSHCRKSTNSTHTPRVLAAADVPADRVSK